MCIRDSINAEYGGARKRRMEAGLRALAELEEEARTLQKANIATRRQLREAAMEAKRDRLAASIARKTEKVARFETAKAVRQQAWQQSHKNQKTQEYKGKLKLEKDTKRRRRKMIDREKGQQTKKPVSRNKPRPASAPPDSPLLQQLSKVEAEKVRQALLSVADTEEETLELERIFANIGSESSPRRLEPADLVAPIQEEPAPPIFNGSVEFKHAQVGVRLESLGGCVGSKCCGMKRDETVVMVLDKSMPLGQNALRWLAQGVGLDDPNENKCVGDCGCVLVFACQEIRSFLEERSCIGVATLSKTRAAHMLPCVPYVLAELESMGVQLPSMRCTGDETVIAIVRPSATHVRASSASALLQTETVMGKLEHKVRAQYLNLLQGLSLMEKDKSASREVRQRGCVARRILERGGEADEDDTEQLQMEQELKPQAEVLQSETMLFHKLLVKLQAGKNPTQLFWEINRAHNGFISFAEWERASGQLGLQLSRSHLKRSFSSMSHRNGKVEYKEFLCKLREYQFKLRGEQKAFMRKTRDQDKTLAVNLYNPLPRCRAVPYTTPPAFSFGAMPS
eukprot:TRINITY_DN24548_c0_g1_i1.p1 TRINITY_DN24548_c0_g1~~TRINITY_DN24548_c0_g1_i1.p1  ORF type:complete len:568 (-),score=124.83 TRINITY_DN24548_c0_g1_i1:239-1942(-)